MKVFLVHQPPDRNGKIKITGKDFHYLRHVRRLQEGDEIRVRDSNGQDWTALTEVVGSDQITLLLKEQIQCDLAGTNVEIHLYLCLTKGKKMDLMVRQAGEAGVKVIFPLLSDHSMVKLPAQKDRQAKLDRWQKILREAIQQSGSPVESRLEIPADFSDIKNKARGPVLFLHQDKINSKGLSEILKDFHGDTIGIAIGPEGGFSTEEVDSMLNWGFHPVYLGANVLRAETASLYGVAAVKTLLGV